MHFLIFILSFIIVYFLENGRQMWQIRTTVRIGTALNSEIHQLTKINLTYLYLVLQK